MRTHSLLKSLASLTSLVSLCVMLAGGQAHAALTTITTTGTIGSAYDGSGVFGTAGADLTGLSYSQAITLDATLHANQFGSGACLPYYPCNFGQGGLTGTASVAVTVGSASQMFTWDLSQSNYGETFIVNSLSAPGSYVYLMDELYQYQSGYTSSGSNLSASGYAYSYSNAFGLTLSFDQSAFYTLQAGDVGETYFQLGASYFVDNSPATISINSSNNVPEPAMLVLFALALVGAGLSHRRKPAL